MTTLQTLRDELGLKSTTEVKKIARFLNIAVKDVKKPIGAKDAKRIRNEVERRRREAEEPEAPDAPPTEEESPPALVKPPPRRDTGPVVGNCHAIHVHTDFLSWLEDTKTPKRFKDKAHFVLRHLFAEGRTPQVKGIRGPAAGWKRSPLGGSGGYQHYLWWLQPGSKQADELGLKPNERFVRCVLHHDDNQANPAVGGRGDYMRLGVELFLGSPEEYGEGLNEEQLEVVTRGAAVRMVKGHPGSGKTTTLLESTRRLPGRRVLYLTYSDRLVSQARKWFDAFAPAALDIRVLSMRELVEQWTGLADGVRDPEVAAEQLAETLADYRGGLGPWDGRFAELYGEIHASVLGAALPFDFRKRKAASGPRLDSRTYSSLRRKALGREAVDAVKRVMGKLSQEQLQHLFPAPLQARAVLDRMESEPLPEVLQGLDWVVVDEVQDLTLVEQALVVRTAARTGGADGARAGLLAAGDEGQTVRPTDFSWGPLNDLCAMNLAPREEFELPGNVRCPPDIASVVNDSWQFYRLFDRNERPRGRAEANLDGASAGRIVRVVADDLAHLTPLMEYFETNPDSEIVYPGFRVPPALRAEVAEDTVWTSRSVKGLDFRTVAVMDVGTRLREVEELAARNAKGKEFATQLCRSRVDQLRVAISRTTDTLLLVDVAPGEAEERLVNDLVRSVRERVLRADPEEARVLLEQETLDPLDRVQRFVEDIRRMVEDQPGRALRRARVAGTLVDDMRAREDEVPADLRSELAQLTARAALLQAIALREQRRLEGITEVLGVADIALRACKAARAARTTRERLLPLLTTPRAESPRATGHAVSIAQVLPQIADEVGELAPLFRRAVLDWVALVANEAPIPEDPKGRGDLAAGLGTLGTLLEEHSVRIAADTQALVRRTALHLLEGKDHQGALTWFRSLAQRDRATEGLCHEHLGDLPAAAQAYEDGERFDDALRCARNIPDFDAANRLVAARGLGTAGDRWSLQWANRLRRVLEERPADDSGARLTDAERKALKGLLNRHPMIGGR